MKPSNSSKLEAVCEISGTVFAVDIPSFPPSLKIDSSKYLGLSPLASVSFCKSLGKLEYSQGLFALSNEVIAGAIITLLKTKNLLVGHSSPVESNSLLSQLPKFELATILKFITNLTEHEGNRIVSLSLDEQEAHSLVAWYKASLACLDISNYAPLTEGNGVVKVGKQREVSIVAVATSKAYSILKLMIADKVLPLRLQSLLQNVCKGNGLVLLTPTLREQIAASLDSLEDADASELAAIIRNLVANLTSKEKLLASDDFLSMEDAVGVSQVVSPKPTMTWAEIRAMKKQELKELEAKRAAYKADPVNTLKAMAVEVSKEVELEMLAKQQKQQQEIDRQWMIAARFQTADEIAEIEAAIASDIPALDFNTTTNLSFADINGDDDSSDDDNYNLYSDGE